MSIDCIDDVIRTLKQLKDDESLVDYLDDSIDDNFENVINYNFIEDQQLSDDVSEVELSASHFFLDDNGHINKSANDKLKKFGFHIEKLSGRPDGCFSTHAVCSDAFKIYFSNY